MNKIECVFPNQIKDICWKFHCNFKTKFAHIPLTCGKQIMLKYFAPFAFIFDCRQKIPNKLHSDWKQTLLISPGHIVCHMCGCRRISRCLLLLHFTLFAMNIAIFTIIYSAHLGTAAAAASAAVREYNTWPAAGNIIEIGFLPAWRIPLPQKSGELQSACANVQCFIN